MAFARELVADRRGARRRAGAARDVAVQRGQRRDGDVGAVVRADIAPGVPWKVATLPIVSATGKPAAPFRGAEGIADVGARARQGRHVRRDGLSRPAMSRRRRARSIAHQVVPNPRAYVDPEVAHDPTLAAFRAQLEHTVPLPNARRRCAWCGRRIAPRSARCSRDAPSPTERLLAVEREVEGYTAGR